MTYTNDELFRCAKRELQMRMRVYPRWVQEGRYTAEKARLEQGMMEEIMLHFSALAEAEQLEGDLFGEKKAVPSERRDGPV